MRTVLRLLLWTSVICAAPARADAFSETIIYTCDTKGDFVQVEYVGSYGEPESTSPLDPKSNAWNPWTLTVPAGDGRRIKDVKTVARQCKLSDAIYVVQISADPCNFDTQGQNGAMMMARAKISKEKRLLVDARLGGCQIEGVVTTKVVLRPGQETPLVTKKPAEEYFQ